MGSHWKTSAFCFVVGFLVCGTIILNFSTLLKDVTKKLHPHDQLISDAIVKKTASKSIRGNSDNNKNYPPRDYDIETGYVKRNFRYNFNMDEVYEDKLAAVTENGAKRIRIAVLFKTVWWTSWYKREAMFIATTLPTRNGIDHDFYVFIDKTKPFNGGEPEANIIPIAPLKSYNWTTEGVRKIQPNFTNGIYVVGLMACGVVCDKFVVVAIDVCVMSMVLDIHFLAGWRQEDPPLSLFSLDHPEYDYVWSIEYPSFDTLT